MNSPAHDLPPLCVLLIEAPVAEPSPLLDLLEQSRHLVTLWDGRRQTLPEGDFDVALANLPIEHLPDVSRMVKALDQSNGARLPLVAVTASAIGATTDYATTEYDSVVGHPPTRDSLEAALAKAMGRGQPLPIVDERHIALLRQSLDPQTLNQLLDTACRSIDETVTLIEVLHAAGDGGGLARAAHRLAGVASNFGCPALALLAETLEKIGSAAVVPWSDLAALAAATTADLRTRAPALTEAG